MRAGITLSAGIHAVVLGMVWHGLPLPDRDPSALDDIVFVRMADMAEVSNLPPEPASEPEQPEARSMQQQAPPPQPEPPPPPEPEPAPEPTPEPMPEPPPPIAQPPAPTPKPVATAATSLTPVPKPRPSNPLPAVSRPESKPEKPEPRRSGLTRLLKDLKKSEPQPPARIAEDRKQALLDRVRDVQAASDSNTYDPEQEITISELDALRRQMASCWNVAAGARAAESLSVEIEMSMNPDATIRQARVVDQVRMRSDPHFRAAAESALRALADPRCSPLLLPAGKYNLWNQFTFNFDPQKMLQ